MSAEWAPSMTMQAERMWEHCEMRNEHWRSGFLRRHSDLSWERLGSGCFLRRGTFTSSSIFSGKNSEISLAPLASLPYCTCSFFPLSAQEWDLQGEGKCIYVVESSGCSPQEKKGVCLEIITSFTPPHCVVKTSINMASENVKKKNKKKLRK